MSSKGGQTPERECDTFDPDATSSFFQPGASEDHEQFRELMAHLEQIFWIEDSTDHLMHYVSPAYATITGRACQSLIDDPATCTDSIHEEDRARVAKAVAGKREGEGYDEEFRIVRPDGEIRWIHARSYPVRDARNVVSRFAGIAEDITERKEAEKENLRLAAIIEYSDDTLVSVTRDGIIVGWNLGAERQYGYTAEEIVGCSLSILFPPGGYDEYLRMIEKIRKGETAPSFDVVRLRKDGKLTDISISLVPVEIRDGEVAAPSKIGHDIARIKNLERQVIESQKMEVVGRLSTGIAHDFNNILSIILSYGELMMRTIEEGHPAKKGAEEIKRAVARGSELTRQLLLFSRRQVAEIVVLDLGAVVAEMTELLGRLIGDRVRLSIETAPEPAAIQADSGYIGQLLMNLVVNARDAMSGEGDLSIATRCVTVTEADPEAGPAVPPGDYVRLSVTDTGAGMSDEVKARIFEAFYTTKPEGTGLGLATCRTIAEHCHAHITVASELEKGTSFDVWFPRVAAAVDAPVPSHELEPLRHGNDTILVVEDEPAVREVASAVLESLGYEVLQAVNGQDGLRVAREHRGSPIRLVLTDVAMPKMSGTVMAEWLKESYPDIKILLTSGYYFDEARYDAGDSSVAFLAKPYTLAALSAKVRDLLDSPN
jgi:two-component system, cell cycle sensor histidine kinase and response regulator CckA